MYRQNPMANVSTSNQFDHLEVRDLDSKIQRTRNLLNRRQFSALSEGANKLKVFLKKLLAEKEQRKQLKMRKAETSTPPPVQGADMFGREDSSRRACVNRNLDYPVNFSSDKSIYSCPLSHSDLTKNVDHRLVTYSKRTRVSDFDSGEEYYSQRKNKVSKCSTSAYLLRRENACRQLNGKESLCLTKQGQTKKKVAQLIVLDEEDDKQSKKSHLDRMKDLNIYYPSRSDPDSVEICYFDMECLYPFSCLSSPIMNFYIRYLQRPESLTPTQRNNYHFFNTYFYNKLDEALCDQTLQDNGDSLVKFRRWLKGINIFEKAYVFLPIYYTLHWSLGIICFPAKEDKSGPLVLHLDSLGLHPRTLIFKNIRRFLKIEWEHLNQTGLPTHIPIEESTWKTLISKIENIKIEVPQQDNNYDCGLFVLYFIERFIKDAPARIRKNDLNMFGRTWFRPAEASRLRDSIRDLLEKHFEDLANAR